MNLGYVSEVVLKEMVDNNLRLFCIYDIYKKKYRSTLYINR